MRAELLALYAEADALLEGWTCLCSSRSKEDAALPACCQFAVIGREPNPTAVELEEVRHAKSGTPRARQAGGARGARSRRGGRLTLPVLDQRPCPLLSRDGRCTIYRSRPLGCRTFFCDDASGPFDPAARLPRARLLEIGRLIADLSARFAPHDPHPRPLMRALAGERR